MLAFYLMLAFPLKFNQPVGALKTFSGLIAQKPVIEKANFTLLRTTPCLTNASTSEPCYLSSSRDG